MTEEQTPRPSLSPRNWLGWIAVAVLWLLGRTPQWFGIAASAPMAWFMFRFMLRRRKVAARNIDRCFPELSAEQREKLLRENFRSLARMVFEVAWSWSATPQRIRSMARIEGADHVLRARERGRGVMYITAHVTCLEMGGRIAAFEVPEAKGVYRPLNNAVLEWYQNRSRKRYVKGSISKRDPRAIIRFLRKGGELWYAPDQDFGARRSIFAPFFGIETATLEATERFVQLSGCAVVPMYPVYDEATRTYVVNFDEPLKDFPSGDAREDLGRINRLFEEKIRQRPEQYWWIHRRFKTRPEGEPPFYD